MERRPIDLQRGSWLAQQGDAGIRFSGLQGKGAGSRLRQIPLASMRSASPAFGVRQNSPPQASPLPGTYGSTVNDALDELLSHARITLRQLDSLSAGRSGKAANTQPRSASSGPRLGAARPTKTKKAPGAGFWKPQCKAHLWSECSSPDSTSPLGSDDDKDDDASTVSSVSGDDTTPADWDCLRRAQYYSPAGGQRGPSPRNTPNGGQGRGENRGGAQPESAGYTGTSSNSHKPPRPPPRTQPGSQPQARPGVGQRPSERGGEEKSSEAKSSPTSSSSRARAAGFRFGGFGDDGKKNASGRCSAGEPGQGPEAEVTSILTSALATGGQEAGRQALRKLLLRWHPDKAVQGESAEAQAAQAEATRVLRFILLQRERLGI